jgi:dihydrofolate reductase
MSKVFSAHAVSVDGYISGRTPDGEEEFGRGLGDAPMLFDWYFDGDTPSQVFDGFKLSEPNARFFDAIAARVGVAVAGRTTYEHSGHWGGGGPHPTARLFVLSHRPVLLGAGRRFFHELPEHVHLRLLEAIPAPGVTHLHYEVVR